MKRFLVSAMSSAVLAAMAPAAFAAVNLDDGTGSVNYAKELVTPAVTALAGGVVDVTSTLGFGVSNNQTRYIRYDLTNAKFGAAVAVANLGMANTTATISQGGSAGSTFVIFQITATTDILQNVTVSFASGTPGLVIQSAGSSVQMAYSLYEDAPSAAAGGAAGRLNNNFAARTVAGLVTGLAFSTTTNTTTVDVQQLPSYTQFLGGSVATIGTVSLDAAANVFIPNGAAVTYTDLVAAGTSLVLRGDFGAAVTPSTATTGVFLGPDNGVCPAAGTAPTPTTPVGGAAIFVTNAAPIVNRPLCFTVKADNAIPIPAQTFTVEGDITAAAGSTTADIAAINAGTFIRNGLVLKAAFAETTSASGVSSSVTLNNTSALPAPYTVSCLVNSAGAKVGKPGTVPAHSSSRLSVSGSNGLGCPSDGTLRGLEITFAVTPGSVVGSVTRQNTSTGQASFDSMTGNQ